MPADKYPLISGESLEPRLAALSPADPNQARVTAVLGGTLLLAYKAYELAPELPMGIFGRCLPVILATLFFAYLRENPLRIVTERMPPGLR